MSNTLTRPITDAQLMAYCQDHMAHHWYITDFNWLKWTFIVALCGLGYLFVKDVVPSLWTGISAAVSSAVAGVKAGAAKVEAAV